MKWAQWLENWDMTSLRITVPVLETNWEPKDADKDAAWELYIELLTRITTQTLDDGHGDEKTALASIHSPFGITRSIIRSYKRDCREFTRIAVVALNQKVRPFAAKWHKLCIGGALDRHDECAALRAELKQLQGELCKYEDAGGHGWSRRPDKSREMTRPTSCTGCPSRLKGASAGPFVCDFVCNPCRVSSGGARLTVQLRRHCHTRTLYGITKWLELVGLISQLRKSCVDPAAVALSDRRFPQHYLLNVSSGRVARVFSSAPGYAATDTQR